MSKDRSLEEIDILKLVIYVLAFLFVCLFFIMFLIVPSIKEYKKNLLLNKLHELENDTVYFPAFVL